VSGQHERDEAEAAGEPVGEGVGRGAADPDGPIGPAEPGTRRARRTRRGRADRPVRRHRGLKIAALITAALVLAAAGTGAYLYKHLLNQIRTISLADLRHRPATATPDPQGNTPENILVLGSQARDGQSGPNLGNSSKQGTDISDTAMLLHVNAERKWAVVVSIPRDLLVARPQCQGRNDPNETIPASGSDMFDQAMNLGGPACAVATVEQMSSVRVDHFVELTFNAFEQLTGIVGGVQVCVPPPGINDPDYSGLVLGPGLHTIGGGQALEFVRDRHGVGDGTDLGRIQYQQMFLSSLFSKLTSAGTLSDPVTLYQIASTVTSNLTVDDGLKSLSALVSLAESVRGLKSHYIQYITAPYVFDPVDPNRVDPGPGFDEVWSDLRNDQPLPGSNAANDFGASAPAAQNTLARDAPASATPAAPTSTAATGAGTSDASPMPSISAESRTGDQNICSDLPTPVPYGGHP
jgi:LCP family protein required for cell wall assembly